jgi:hypothetical protein
MKLVGDNMWKISDLKNKAKKDLQKSYWVLVAICFLMAILASKYPGTTTLINSYGTSKNTKTNVVNNVTKTSNYNDLLKLFPTNSPIHNLLRTGKPYFEKIYNGSTDSVNYVYKLIDTCFTIIKKKNIAKAIPLFIASLLSIAYILFISNVLQVGEAYAFLNSAEEHLKIRDILFPFKNKKYLNFVKTIFLSYLYKFFWSLTIVMIPVKHYQYKMLPYILAEDPTISGNAAIKKSIDMMKGNKWHAFLLDLSYIGWDILSSFTVGLLAIFYVNPYYTATETNLYKYLKTPKKATK